MTHDARWLGSFLRDNAVVWVGVMILNLATYATQVLVARQLGQIEFGSFMGVAALANLFFLPTAGIQTIVARQSAWLAGREGQAAAGALAWRWLSRFALAGLIVGLAWLVLRDRIARLMQLGQAWPVALLAPAALAALWLPVVRGVWQGTQRFGWLAASMGVEGILRFALAVSIALTTSNGAGAAASYGLAALGVCLLAAGQFPPARWLPRSGGQRASRGAAVPILIAGIGLMLLFNVDMLAVKHFGSAADAGNYAAATFVGRIAVFASATIPLVMLPKILQRAASGRGSLRIFVSSIVLVLLVCLVILAWPLAHPAGFARAVFGPAFVLDQTLMLVYGIAATSYALVATCANLYFAIGRTLVAWFIIGSVAVQGALLLAFHGSPKIIAACTAMALLGMLVGFLVDMSVARRHIFASTANTIPWQG